MRALIDRLLPMQRWMADPEKPYLDYCFICGAARKHHHGIFRRCPE